VKHCCVLFKDIGRPIPARCCKAFAVPIRGPTVALSPFLDAGQLGRRHGISNEGVNAMAENLSHNRFGNEGTSGGVAEKTRDAVSGITGSLRDAAAGVADTAKGWASNVADTAQTIAHGAENAYSATRDAVVGGEESVERFIRRHPIPVVMGAFMVGCLFGCAVRASRN
jgi:hypothetical protein